MPAPTERAKPDARRMRPHGLLGELVGPAGAGKTALLRALASRDAHVVPGLPLTRLEQLPHYARHAALLLPAVLRRPRAALSFSWAQARSMSYLRAWQKPAKRLLADHHLLVIMDHGPVFRLAFLREFGSAITRSSAFRGWWEQSCTQWAATLRLLIWLDAPDAILIERVRARDAAHAIKGKSDAEARAFLARYRRALDEVIHRLDSATGPLVLRFDTERVALDEIANHVLGALEERARVTPV